MGIAYGKKQDLVPGSVHQYFAFVTPILDFVLEEHLTAENEVVFRLSVFEFSKDYEESVVFRAFVRCLFFGKKIEPEECITNSYLSRDLWRRAPLCLT